MGSHAMLGLATAALISACGGGDPSSDGSADGIDSGLSSLSSGNQETETSGSNNDNSDEGLKFDVEYNDSPGPGGDCADGNGMGGMNGESFSYIWISNSPQGTVSKINTETGIEEARYAAGPGAADPSRTSVNLLGDAVVVDRSGGIAKIAVIEDRCVDLNNNGAIDTSTGPNNVLPWGTDECVLWHVPLPSGGTVANQYGPRPVAWEGVGPEDCTKPRVWVGWRDASTGFFRRLDGETGDIQDAASVPWPGDQWGPYGGATNKQGDFWVMGWQYGPLVRVDAETVVPQVIQIPTPPNGSQQWTYGMALDADGHPWIAGAQTVYHYNPDTDQWEFIDVPGGNFRGMMIDAEGRAWVANNGSSFLVEVDTMTKTVANAAVPLPGAGTPVGISIDSEGKVWVVDQAASMAFKVDPDTYQTLLTVSGLQQPYTYSDMTGAGLGLVTFPPQG
jgi:hypothetical protein